MSQPTLLNRSILYKRHRLSHQQIDNWLGEKEARNHLPEKFQLMTRTSEFLEIAKSFAENNISFIPLKGPLLSYRIYNDPSYRYFNDLDFLIATDSIEAAIRIFNERGYETPVYDLPAEACRRKILYRHMNEILFYNPGKRIGIDLHWQLLTGGRNINDQLLVRLIKSNQIKLSFQGQVFTVFAPEFELLYLIIHGGLHAWRRLKWLVDIRDMTEKMELDQLLFKKLTGEMNAGRLVALCNQLLDIYFPTAKPLPCDTPPSDFLLGFAQYSIRMETDQQKRSFREYLKSTWYTLHVFPVLGYKISMLKNIFFATDLADSKWIPCSPLLYYLLSPFWKIKRGFR